VCVYFIKMLSLVEFQKVFPANGSLSKVTVAVESDELTCERRGEKGGRGEGGE